MVEKHSIAATAAAMVRIITSTSYLLQARVDDDGSLRLEAMAEKH